MGDKLYNLTVTGLNGLLLPLKKVNYLEVYTVEEDIMFMYRNQDIMGILKGTDFITLEKGTSVYMLTYANGMLYGLFNPMYISQNYNLPFECIYLAKNMERSKSFLIDKMKLTAQYDLKYKRQMK